jgi:hypothetical protein
VAFFLVLAAVLFTVPASWRLRLLSRSDRPAGVFGLRALKRGELSLSRVSWLGVLVILGMGLYFVFAKRFLAASAMGCSVTTASWMC